MVQLAPGLGLTNRIIVDQHFRQRDRLGRLLTALAFNPFAVGMGLDEDTAAFIGPDDTLEVVGSGGLTIVDPAAVEFSSMDSAKPGDPVSLVGVRLHVLVRGGRYDLQARVASVEHPELEEEVDHLQRRRNQYLHPRRQPHRPRVGDRMESRRFVVLH